MRNSTTKIQLEQLKSCAVEMKNTWKVIWCLSRREREIP